ncbi:MAG: aminoacyl-histidine dipeptidase [Thermoplasmata archaeon]|nr:MAG: aminoacyl-histidine dipeptidase [Thermoplasmata archaeon]
MSILLELQPELLWKHFDDVRKIPRCSKHEEKIREHVVNFAKSHNLEYKEDKIGNIVIKKPGSAGKENAPVTILQGHLDIVCEKDTNTVHDFDKDPIEVERDGDYITAKGTSLGADNGIGVAAALAALESTDLVHGPLECLFTVDEETGLTGAFQLQPDFLEGRCMLNMDSEEEGSIYVGCAGGSETTLTLPVTFVPAPKDALPMKVSLSGLRGGHSGVDIHEQRGNAIKILIRTLHAMAENNKYYIGEITGGSKRNAIPREAYAMLMIDQSDKGSFIDDIKNYEKALQDEYRPMEKDFHIVLEEDIDKIANVLDDSHSRTVLHLIDGLPDGVLAMSYSIPDLVETSTNLATVKTTEKEIVIGMLSRGSMDSSMKATEQHLASIGALAGTKVEHSNFYPGWKANLDSKVLKYAQETYKELFGKDAEVKAIHAGLETGIIGVKFPGMDMISIGPQIENPHSPEERVQIPSVENFWKFVNALLTRLAS